MKLIAKFGTNAYYMEDDGSLFINHYASYSELLINDEVAIDKELRGSITMTNRDGRSFPGEIIFENETRIIIYMFSLYIYYYDKNDEAFKINYKRTYTKANINYIKDNG